MIVTRFNYPLEKRMIRKLDLIAERVTKKNPKKDAVLIIEAPEGEGKTTLSVAQAYYLSEKTSRPFDATRVFFDLEKMINFLKDRDEEIVIWDEPALSSLAKDSMTKIVRNLERLLMMARKKRHIIIINIAYFNKFSDYIVWQRPVGMFHLLYSNKHGQQRFVYIKKKNLELLYRDWRSKKLRNYMKYCSKGCKGTFPDVLNPDKKYNVLSHFDINYYEEMKDKAISSIGENSKDISQNKYFKDAVKLKYGIAIASNVLKEKYNITKTLFSNMIGTQQDTMKDWIKFKEKYPQVFAEPEYLTHDFNVSPLK